MKKKILKITILIAVIIILIITGIKLIPIFKNISTEAGRIQFKNEIENLGTEGILVITGLMVSQIFVPILPGEPVEVLAGMCYGAIGGLLVIYLGAFLSSCIIFFAVRKFGREFIYTFIEKEKIEKLEKSKIFSNQKKLNTIIFILFFIPGTPKDLFVYLGGLLPVKASDFLLISTLARLPSIISSTIVGSNILVGNWKFIIIVYLITLIASLVMIYLVNKKDKEVIEVIK